MPGPNKPTALGRRSLLAGAGTLMTAPAVHAQGRGAGVALVIGNSKYHWEAQLPNVKRDAPDIAKRFQGMGLKTELVQDADRDTMRRAVDALHASARGANLAAVYFAGHGANWANLTYLVPVDADLGDPTTVKTLIPTNVLREGMDPAQHRLLVFDNCRNNPADGWRQKEAADFAGVPTDLVTWTTPDTLVLFSTAPGRVALDGPPGSNSPFAAALMRQLDAPTVDLQGLPAKLRRDLLIATEARQLLFDRSTYQQPFTVKGSGQASAASSAGWAGDASHILELPKVYAAAQQANMALPAGLVAHRAPSGENARKVGSYKTADPRGYDAFLIVLSVDSRGGVELVLTGRDAGSARAGWRFFHGQLSGNNLEFSPSQRAGTWQMSWSDANSGRIVTLGMRGSAGGGKAAGNVPFTRLDG